MSGTESSIPSTVFGMLAQGGPFMVVLLVLSIASLTVIGAKLWHFHSRGVGRRKFLAPALHAWHSHDRVSAMNMVSRERGPLAATLLAAMQAIARRTIDVGTINGEVERMARSQLTALDSGMRGLELIAYVAVLIGLLATVTSLLGLGVEPGRELQAGLVTTGTGLLVSIVTAAFYYLLDARIERERRAIESAATAVLGEGLQPPRDGQPPDEDADAVPSRDDDFYDEEDDEFDDEDLYEPELR